MGRDLMQRSSTTAGNRSASGLLRLRQKERGDQTPPWDSSLPFFQQHRTNMSNYHGLRRDSVSSIGSMNEETRLHPSGSNNAPTLGGIQIGPKTVPDSPFVNCCISFYLFVSVSAMVILPVWACLLLFHSPTIEMSDDHKTSTGWATIIVLGIYTGLFFWLLRLKQMQKAGGARRHSQVELSAMDRN
eukprot:GDKI01049752.1.p1 GENE.GDKI01049752.1~~GDKI01049752.1.p1  ORF type:complete len:187 (+),score=12.03 GDKI01049752.1:1-561(+)